MSTYDLGVIRNLFFQQFSAFTQHTYLMAYAAAAIQDIDAQELADGLHLALEQLVDEDDPRWNDELQGDAGKIRKAKKDLPRFVIELCVVDLDARLHALLDDIAQLNDAGAQESAPFENQLQPVRSRDPEVYGGVILLAEVRNAIIHSNRKLSEERIPRLTLAGVQESLIKEYSQKLKQGLKLADFLQFKRAVRAAANMILEEHGGFRSDSPR